MSHPVAKSATPPSVPPSVPPHGAAPVAAEANSKLEEKLRELLTSPLVLAAGALLAGILVSRVIGVERMKKLLLQQLSRRLEAAGIPVSGLLEREATSKLDALLALLSKTPLGAPESLKKMLADFLATKH